MEDDDDNVIPITPKTKFKPRQHKPTRNVFDPTKERNDMTGYAPSPGSKGGRTWKPDTIGRYKSGVLDWSVDELIAYKQTGATPKRIPDVDILYKLGKAGVSIMNSCDIFGISADKFSSNPDWSDAHAAGRAQLGSKIRTSLVEDALERDNTTVKIYLDKILGGDREQPQVVVNIKNNELQEYSTEDLINLAFKETPDDSTEADNKE
jgi:hypothetical protein